MKTIIQNKTYDEERALYHLEDTKIIDCTFAGEADGESVLKESHNIDVDNCSFALRYPLWHATEFTLINSKMNDKTRAPLWYCHNALITDTQINGTKCLRESSNITITKCQIVSAEFGWKCDSLKIIDSIIESEYLFLDSSNIAIDKLQMKGKYSFQYIKNLQITNSNLDTKDAFWHTENVTVRDSVIKGEYLAWFSKNLTLINCHIIGTQPFCYCESLKLINCTMTDCDLAFEYSDVEADIVGHVDSIKNPKSGTIKVDSVGEIITSDSVITCQANIIVGDK